MFPRSLFILFTMFATRDPLKEETYIYVHTQGKTGVAGSPLSNRYEFLIFS